MILIKFCPRLYLTAGQVSYLIDSQFKGYFLKCALPRVLILIILQLYKFMD